MKTFIRRVLGVCLVLVTLLNMSSISLAVDSNEVEESPGAAGSIGNNPDQWQEVKALTISKQSPENIYNQISGSVVDLEKRISASISPGNGKDATTVMTCYGQLLAYMHWFTANGYRDSSGGFHTIFDLPISDNSTGSTPVDLNTAKDLLYSIRTTTEEISNSELLSDTSNAMGGSWFNADAIQSPDVFPEFDPANPNALLNSRVYLNALNKLMKHYVDDGIIAFLLENEIKSSDEFGFGSTSQVDSALNLSSDPDKAKSIMIKYVDELSPLLQVANNIQLAYQSIAGYGLADQQIGDTIYNGVQLVNSDIMSGISGTTQALLKAKFDSQTGTIIDTDMPSVSDIDKTNDPLYLMSNAGIIDDQIVFDSDKKELKNIGYHILAAGACYDPFVSIAGNDMYIQVIKYSVPEEDVQDVMKVLRVALNTKKPLYVTETGKYNWKDESKLSALTIAEYRPATLADALHISESKTKAFVVVKGSMQISKVDSSTWDYVNYGVSTNGAVRIKDGNVSGVVTVGTEYLSATEDQVTPPVMITAGASNNILSAPASGIVAAIGGITSILLNNAIKDVKDNSHLQNADSEGLYLNGLGDIVLYDDTVVLPAIANPVLYNYQEDGVYDYLSESGYGSSDGTMGSQDSLSAEQKLGYYPYTAAFMNHYPEARINAENKLDVTPSNDVDKYILMLCNDRLYAKRIKTVGESAEITFAGGLYCSRIYGNSMQLNSDGNRSAFIVAEGSGGIGSMLLSGLASATDYVVNKALKSTGIKSISNFIKGILGSEDPEGSDAGLGGYDMDSRNHILFVTTGTVYLSSDIPLFPLQATSPDIAASYINSSILLKRSAINFLKNPDTTTGDTSASPSFNMANYIESFLGEGMLGTQYKETLVKNNQMSYDDIVSDTGGRLLKFFVNITDSALESLGRIDGVLSIKGPYNNKFFNLIVIFVQDFYMLLAIMLLIIVAVKFLKGHYNLIYVCFISLLCVAGFELYANLLPTVIPSVYNSAVNDAIEDIVWNTVIHNAESYDETYRDSNRMDASTGDLKPYTATITLYQLTRAEIESVAAGAGVDVKDVRKGKMVFLDPDAGIFLQGNQIKMSLDKLLVNNSLRGLYKSQWEELQSTMVGTPILMEPVSDFGPQNPYSIQLTQPYVSLESYYTPYDHFERAFLVQLNTFTNIMRIKRNTFCYGDGALYKDAFVVRSFVTSGIVTAPGDDEILRNNIDMGLLRDSWNVSRQEVVDCLNKYFYPQEDWLNLRAVFMQPDVGVRESLWGNMMLRREWYTNDWQMTPKGAEAIWDLTMYINEQTKQFVIDNIDQIGYISDENAIKIISLYATTCFTHYMSEIGYWLYPNYVNASDLELQDVLYGSMTTLKDRNFAYDGTVTNTVAVNLGIFGIIFLLLIIVSSVLFVFTMTYLVPILYALFGGVLVFKLINDDSGAGLVKGYFKVTFTTAFLYLCYSLGLKLVDAGGYNWYGYFGCLLVTLLCIYFLFWVILSVIQDVGELGNNTLTANLIRGLDNLTRGAVQRLYADTTRLRTNISRRRDMYTAQRYTRSYNVDDYEYRGASRRGYSSGVYGDDFGGSFNPFTRPRQYSGIDDAYSHTSDFDSGYTEARRSKDHRSPFAGIRGIRTNWKGHTSQTKSSDSKEAVTNGEEPFY